jgi:hypothetical protein
LTAWRATFFVDAGHQDADERGVAGADFAEKVDPLAVGKDIVAKDDGYLGVFQNMTARLGTGEGGEDTEGELEKCALNGAEDEGIVIYDQNFPSFVGVVESHMLLQYLIAFYRM